MILRNKIVGMLNGFLRKWDLQELTEYEASELVMYYLERHAELEAQHVLPYKEGFAFAPAQFFQLLIVITKMITGEMLDLLFTLRGVESVYCLKGRNYHENREGDSRKRFEKELIA